MLNYSVPYGTTQIEFAAPSGSVVTVIQPHFAPRIALETETAKALAQPIGTAPLAEIAKPGQKACIVFTDATREVPDAVLAHALLAELKRAGLHDDDIFFLCGVGMHRPSTTAEKITKLGAEIVGHYRVLDSLPREENALTYLGEHQDIPLWVNRWACEADLLLATGVVEPHQYAGYSGGRKTVAIGAGGESTIAASHSPQMIERPGVRLGNTNGNPFHEAISESARRAGLKFVVNVIKDADGTPAIVAAGEPTTTFNYLVAQAKALYETPVNQQYDIAIAGVGYPKDANLYQASRAITYLYFAPQPVLRPGGVIIVPARCQEGAGTGVGEQRFAAAMRTGDTPEAVVHNLRNTITLAGEQRAYLLAKALQGCRAIIVGSEDEQAVRDCHMTPTRTIQAALDLATAWTNQSPDILLAPHSLLCIARGPAA